MSDWQRVRLGDVASVASGFAFKSDEFQTSGIPVIKIKNVRVGKLDLADGDFVSREYTRLPQKYHSLPGDILISLTGSHISQPNSVVGRVAKHSDGTPPCLINQRVGKVIIRDKKIADPEFFFFALSNPDVVSAIAMFGHGSASQANVSPTQVESLEFDIPPLETQRRIASILGAYDDLIEVNRRRVAVLEEMARGLFEEWFVRFRFPGHETVPILDTPDGPLPEGWRWGAFRDLASEVRTSISPGEIGADTAYIGLEHLPRRSTTLDQIGCAGDVSSLKLEFRRGDILFGKIRPYFHKVAWASISGVCSTDAIVWRPISRSTAQALALASSDAFVAHSVQTSNGTKMPRANARVLADYLCAIAPPYLSQSFEQTALPLIELAAALQSASTRLATSRDLLLPRLISGQLSVASAERELEKVA